MNEGKVTAKATFGLRNVIIVADCPYCHKRHEHHLGSRGEAGVRQAGCMQGEYVLDFTKEEKKEEEKP